MGSYCSLRIGDISVFEFKSAVPDSLVALFQESDLVHTVSPESESDTGPTIAYVASRDVALRRLSLLGFTEEAVGQRFTGWIESERARFESYLDDGGENWASKTHETLKAFSFETWRARAPQALAERYERTEPRDEVDRNMRGSQGDGWIYFDGYGSLITLRALLDVCLDVQTVSLDISDLVGGGWIGENEAICADRREADAIAPRDLAPTVVLAEGSSDIRILRRSLSAVFPEFADYFSFFDHEELKVDGGAHYLLKFLKAFAAARAPMQLIAIFDNDSIGRQALAAAKALGLPRNILVVGLPDVEIARCYPTLGPQGRHDVDVNGTAASIELYLGRKALTRDDGELRPVRWAGYVSQIDAYQGEVEGKQEVERRFLADLATTADVAEARRAYPELVAIWTTIFAATQTANTEAQTALPRTYELDW